jgi:hypothetical protein
MRKLILISVFVLASVSAHAGESRNMTLAANDEPKATEKVETAKPEETKAQETKTQETTADVKADAAAPEASKPRAPRSKKVHARHYEGDEAKARRIAARYGVYW